MPLSLSAAESAAVVPTRPSGSARAGLRLQIALCATAAFGLALLWQAQGGWVFPLDDAYITLHNAAVLREGADANFGVPALTGATSLIHLALVALLGLLLPPVLASYVVAGAGVLGLLTGLAAMARRFGLPRPEAALFVLLGMATAAPQLLNGLETGLAMAAVAWALVLASERPTRRLALLCGLLPFLRPELGLLSLVLMGRQAWLRLAAEPSRVAALRAVAIDAALALAVAAPWLAWSVVETGALLPSTLAAKQAFFAVEPHALPVGLAMVAVFVVGGTGPAVAALILLRRDPLAPVLWAFAGLFALGFALTLPEIVGQNGNRYAYLLLPVAFLALARLAAARGLALTRAVLAAQCLFCAVLLRNLPTTLAEAQAAVRAHAAVVDWAQAHLPAGSRLLIHDAGMPAFRTRLTLADMVGLKSPDSAADHRRWTAPSGGADRPRALDAIARRAGATHALILDDRPDPFWLTLADDLARAGWRLDPVELGGVTSAYRLYRLTPPGSAT